MATALLAMPSGGLFPGPLALWPVVGAAGVLVATTDGGESYLTTLLSHPWMRAIGAISYSLYLWHWPIFSFIDYAMVMSTEPMRILAKISLCLAAAVVSYRWIELPSRAWLGQRRHAVAAFAFLGLTMVIGPVWGGWIRSHDYLDATAQQLAAGGIEVNPGGHDGSVMLIGDSIGSMYGTALRDACVLEGCKLFVLSTAGQDPLISTPDADNRLWEHTMKAIVKERPDVVVIGYSWHRHVGRQAGFPAVVLNAIRPHVRKIVLIDAVPDVPVSGTRAAIREGSRPPFQESEAGFMARSKTNRLLADSIDNTVGIVTASRHFSRSGREVVVLDARGRYLYHDRSHLSGWGADLVCDDFRRLLREVCHRRN